MAKRSKSGSRARGKKIPRVDDDPVIELGDEEAFAALLDAQFNGPFPLQWWKIQLTAENPNWHLLRCMSNSWDTTPTAAVAEHMNGMAPCGNERWDPEIELHQAVLDEDPKRCLEAMEKIRKAWEGLYSRARKGEHLWPDERMDLLGLDPA